MRVCHQHPSLLKQPRKKNISGRTKHGNLDPLKICCNLTGVLCVMTPSLYSEEKRLFGNEINIIQGTSAQSILRALSQRSEVIHISGMHVVGILILNIVVQIAWDLNRSLMKSTKFHCRMTKSRRHSFI